MVDAETVYKHAGYVNRTHPQQMLPDVNELPMHTKTSAMTSDMTEMRFRDMHENILGVF